MIKHMTAKQIMLTAVMISLCFILGISRSSFAISSVYSIQTGSFPDLKDSQNQFDYLIDNLENEDIDSLRIEKIGKHYTVRMGKFDKYADAETLQLKIKTYIDEAIVVKAYIKDERIIKLYKYPLPADSQKIEKEPPKEEVKKRPILSKSETISRVAKLLDDNDLDAALAIVKDAIAEEPDDPSLNAWTGSVYLKMDNSSEALRYFKRAVELSPDVADYHNGLGYSLLFMDRLDKAIDEFRRVLDLQPAHLDALAGICIVYIRKGDKQSAMGAYNKLNGLDQKSLDNLKILIDNL